jgi:hypothetical protein
LTDMTSDQSPQTLRIQTLRMRHSLDSFIKHKFGSEAVIKRLRDYGFLDGQYQKVIVTWDSNPAFKATVASAGIELWDLQSIVQDLAKWLGDESSPVAYDTLRLLRSSQAKINSRFSFKTRKPEGRLSLIQLWDSRDPRAWDHYESEIYDAVIKPENREIERELEKPGLRSRIGRMSAMEFHDFLRDDYYTWRFPSKAQRIGAVDALDKYVRDGALDLLEKIRLRLVNRDYASKGGAIQMLMGKRGGIKGLSLAGASGLLALVYPEEFGTVDATVAKALKEIGAPDVMKVNPKDISVEEAEIMIEIMRFKALELNRAFDAYKWTPRRVARVLSVAGR